MASNLNLSKPVLKDMVIHLTYPNQMILDEVKKNQTYILNYLRNKLQNHQIVLKLILDEAIEKKYAYTSEEKYQKLQEMNPLLDELRKTLFLGI